MRKILFILTIPFFIISCSDKSIIISEDRKEVFNENIEIEINSEASSEVFNLGNEISNQGFTHLGLNKSHSGGHLLGPNNKLLKSWVKDIGKGLSKDFSLMPNLVAINNMIDEIKKPVDPEINGSARKAELQSIKQTATDCKELLVERQRLEQMIKDLKDSGEIERAKDYTGGFAERFSK